MTAIILWYILWTKCWFKTMFAFVPGIFLNTWSAFDTQIYFIFVFMPQFHALFTLVKQTVFPHLLITLVNLFTYQTTCKWSGIFNVSFGGIYLFIAQRHIFRSCWKHLVPFCLHAAAVTLWYALPPFWTKCWPKKFSFLYLSLYPTHVCDLFELVM